MPKSKSESDLYFFSSVDKSGFTSSKGNFRWDEDPSAIMRELIQNSLDARYPSEKAIVQFILDEVDTVDIPGIDSYRKAFKRAVQFEKDANNGKLTSKTKMIVDRISRDLEKKTQRILIVQDNGIGLNKKAMDALLSDGRSHKPGSDTSSGTFGIGHLAVFAISNLRYLLYGSVGEEGRIAGGHAILASHKDKEQGKLLGGSGYYINKRYMPDFKYTDNKGIPIMISGILDQIEKESNTKKKHSTGTAVIITAFNHFSLEDELEDEKKELSDVIREAAACNFFVAIHQGDLEIVIENRKKNSSFTINSTNLGSELNSVKNRDRDGEFLSGYKANASYNCLLNGDLHKVDLLGEKVEIYILKGRGYEIEQDLKYRITLCRNGMYITSNTSNKKSRGRLLKRINGHEPFEALILVSPDNKKFHKLVRNAEGPYHNELKYGDMDKKEQNKLREAFIEIINYIKGQVPKVSSEEHIIKNILLFRDREDNAGSPGTEWWHSGKLEDFQGDSGEREDRSDKTDSDRPDRPDPIRKKHRKLSEHFRVVPTPKGSNGWMLSVRSMEGCDNAELHLILDEHTDATTDPTMERADCYHHYG